MIILTLLSITILIIVSIVAYISIVIAYSICCESTDDPPDKNQWKL